MLAMIVKVKIRPEQRERFLAAIEDDAICSERDEPGCLRFNVLQDQADENQYYFLEIYRDEDALAAHQQTPHYARWMAARAEVVESAERIKTNTVFPRDPAYWG
jgi:(4S)-4-hydroxy-5-phosphonooxypentane-2,3-dione isomerase